MLFLLLVRWSAEQKINNNGAYTAFKQITTMQLNTKGIRKFLQPGTLLLACILITVLVLPLMPDYYIKLLYALHLSAIFFFLPYRSIKTATC